MLPFVTLAMGIEGRWEMIVRGEKHTKRGVLRHRFDEAAAMCSEISYSPYIMDATEAHDFIVKFRRQHPVSAYINFEKALEAISPTSASRSDRSGIEGIYPPRYDDEEVSSPHVHHVRPNGSDIASIQDVRRPLFQDPICEPRSTSSNGSHYTLTSALSSAAGVSTSLSYVVSEPDAALRIESYLRDVEGPPFMRCQCTAKSFCTSSVGDVYETISGFAIVVCPPPNHKISDD
jgi:hypothetical protein